MLRIALIGWMFLVANLVYSQNIQAITFEGLERTKEKYLLQFILSQEGTDLDSLQLEADKQRLINLEVLANATYRVDELTDGYQVVFQCDELHTLLPIFSFGGIKENFWIQAGATEVNLRGMGNKLITYYQYYDRSSFATHLTFDRIKQSPWGLNINVIKWGTLEPLFFDEETIEYEYSNITLGATGVRHLNFLDKIEFGGAYFTENYQRYTQGTFEGVPDEVDKRKILGKTSITFNRVNYFFFYLDGWHNQLNLQTVQSLDGDPAFYIFFNDYKWFDRVGAKGNFASRLRVGLSSNEDSPFAPFVLDSYLNIRGVGNRVDRGTGAIILNAEYRYALRDKRVTAIQGVIFSDLGSWRIPGGDFGDFSDPDNLVLFAGGGIRLIHKQIFNAIFRIDYGFDLQDPERNGFVLGIGQYF